MSDQKATLSDGVEYTFGAMDLNDWQAFAIWANMQEGLPPAKPRSPSGLIETANTFTGGIWVMQRAVAKHHRDVTDVKLRGLLGDMGTYAEVWNKLLSGILCLPLDDGTPDRPTEGDPQTP